jgi:hypothetical protein
MTQSNSTGVQISEAMRATCEEMGRAYVLAVAAALETLLAGDARTARPLPDIEKLRAAPPISASANFLGFD